MDADKRAGGPFAGRAMVAMAAAAAMMAHYIGSKAVRDAVFLTNFPVSALPLMMMAAAAVSFLSVLASSRAMNRFTPGKLVPFSFALSAAVTLAVWTQMEAFPRATAVVLYLQIVGLGSLLTSGFWSIVSESFEPREAKREVGRIAGAGTLGGILGGVAAERMGAMAAGVGVMLPLLACYHAAVALALWAFPGSGGRRDAAPEEDGPSIWGALRGAPYLRTLALLVTMGTMSAAMLEYVFKWRAAEAYGNGADLLRFFALYYAVAGVLSFLVQTGLSATVLQKLGVARTVGTLPMAVSVGGTAALIAPGLASAVAARGMEQVFRNSLFRAGYELFYMPIPAREKRAAKQAVDVGFDRLGDALGSALVRLMLFLGPAVASQAILTAAILVGVAGLWVASRLQSAYIGALEHSLLDRAEELDLMPGALGITGGLESSPLLPGQSGVYQTLTMARQAERARSSAQRVEIPVPAGASKTSAGAGAAPSSVSADPVLAQISELRSFDAVRVRRMLATLDTLKPAAVPHVIQLLGWDLLYPEAIQALRRRVEPHVGALTDALIDPETEFSIRRRLPRVLSAARSQRAVDGLALGLDDRRFEVRYQCGRAMAAIQEANPGVRIGQAEVLERVLREVNVSRPVWEGHRLLDRGDEGEVSAVVDEFVRSRSSRSLEHVFTLLSLVLPKEPLRIAYRGLHTEDVQLRGTALEYLDSTLPAEIRERLWPLLDTGGGTQGRHEGRPTDEVLEELMRSNQSILVNLAELRRRAEEE